MARKIWKWTKRIILTLLSIAVLLLVVVVLFAGPIGKFVLQKYDTEWLGRELEIEKLRIRLLSGRVIADGLAMLEQDPSDTWISIDKLDGRTHLWPLLSNRVEVDTLHLHRPQVSIIQSGQNFNYDDFFAYLLGDDAETEEPAESKSWVVNLNGLGLNDGTVVYKNRTLKHTVIADELNVQSPGISTEDGRIDVQGNFVMQETSGRITVVGYFDYITREYLAGIFINNFDLKPLQPYLAEYLKVSALDGKFDMLARVSGDFQDDYTYAGAAGILFDEFKIVDENRDSVFAFTHLGIEVDTFNSVDKSYKLSKINIREPYIRYAMYEEGDNFTAMLQHPTGSADTIVTQQEGAIIPGQEYFNVFIYLGEYASYLAKTYLESNYAADTIQVTDGRIVFEDFSLNEDVKFIFEELEMQTSKFNSENEFVTVQLNTLINQNARLEANWHVNPKDVLEMDLDYKLRGLSISSISPYSSYYTAYPLLSGKLVYEGEVHIHERQLDSDNAVYVEDIGVAKKQYDDPPVNLPVRLAVSILRDPKGNIDFKVPVKGSLDDPEFKYWKIIWKVVKNLLIKAATAPYNLLASLFSVDEESLREIPYAYGKSYLSKEGLRRMKNLAKVLDQKREITLKYYPKGNAAQEKNFIALEHCRQLYFERTHGSASGPDSADIAQLNPTDSLFKQFILANSTVGDRLASVSDHCRSIMGEGALTEKYRNTVSERHAGFISHLTDSLGIDPLRIQLWAVDSTVVRDTINLIRPTYLLNFGIQEGDTTATE